MMANAISDAVLVLVCVLLSWRLWPGQAGIRWALASMAAAAVLGTLKFAGVGVLAGPHAFFSMVATVGAVPLLAASFYWPDGLVATHPRAAALMLIVTAAIAVLLVAVSGLPASVTDALLSVPAAVALLQIGVAVTRRGSRGQQAGALLLLLAFACTLLPVAQWPHVSVQGLHYFLAAGLWLLCAPLADRLLFAPTRTKS